MMRVTQRLNNSDQIKNESARRLNRLGLLGIGRRRDA